MPSNNDIADQSGSGKSIFQSFVRVLIYVGLAWVAFTVVREWLVYGLFFHYVDEFAEKTGLNLYLVYALAAACVSPFVVGLKYYFSPLSSRSKNRQGAAILLGMIAVYNLALYAATRDDAMGKFYTITTEGVRYSDRALGDGREWLLVTRDNIWYVAHLAVGKRVDDVGRDWFDQKSGLPLLWYSKVDDQVEFYDGPGFDRSTGKELKPVTAELNSEWRRSARSRTVLPAPIRDLPPPGTHPDVHPQPGGISSPTATSPGPTRAPAPPDPVQIEEQRTADSVYREKMELIYKEFINFQGTLLLILNLKNTEATKFLEGITSDGTTIKRFTIELIVLSGLNLDQDETINEYIKRALGDLGKKGRLNEIKTK